MQMRSDRRAGFDDGKAGNQSADHYSRTYVSASSPHCPNLLESGRLSPIVRTSKTLEHELPHVDPAIGRGRT
jgi:hypothetical protein